MRFPMLLLFALALASVAVGQTSSPAPSSQSPTPGSSGHARGNLEVLTDTEGVDFGPYLQSVLMAIRKNWYNLIPEQARPPQLQAGEVAIEFGILPDGKVAGMTIDKPSGSIPLDRAAWGGITSSAPFKPLPEQFHGPQLKLRFHFIYNPAKAAVPGAGPSSAPATKPPDYR